MAINHQHSNSRRPIRGLIFDLDGTLVDSGLDFDLMRLEMGIAPGHSILEALAKLPDSEAQACHVVLDRHERAGVKRARAMPGAIDFVSRVATLGWRRAVLTRNSREMSLATLQKFGLDFDPVIAREDAPPKPDPTAIWRICEYWGVAASEVAVIGDYRYDLEAGRSAGARTVLFQGSRELLEIPYRGLADFVLPSFSETDSLLEWLAEST